MCMNDFGWVLSHSHFPIQHMNNFNVLNTFVYKSIAYNWPSTHTNVQISIVFQANITCLIKWMVLFIITFFFVLVGMLFHIQFSCKFYCFFSLDTLFPRSFDVFVADKWKIFVIYFRYCSYILFCVFRLVNACGKFSMVIQSKYGRNTVRLAPKVMCLEIREEKNGFH